MKALHLFLSLLMCTLTGCTSLKNDWAENGDVIRQERIDRWQVIYNVNSPNERQLMAYVSDLFNDDKQLSLTCTPNDLSAHLFFSNREEAPVSMAIGLIADGKNIDGGKWLSEGNGQQISLDSTLSLVHRLVGKRNLKLIYQSAKGTSTAEYDISGLDKVMDKIAKQCNIN